MGSRAANLASGWNSAIASQRPSPGQRGYGGGSGKQAVRGYARSKPVRKVSEVYGRGDTPESVDRPARKAAIAAKHKMTTALRNKKKVVPLGTPNAGKMSTMPVGKRGVTVSSVHRGR